MSVKAAADETYETLKTALEVGKFPANVVDTAEKLCHRLKEPVRLTVMGMPNSGKSTLVNLLLNKIVMPEGIKLPTAQFVKGETAQAVCTRADGTTQTVHGADAHEIAACEPIFVEFQMPLPALGRISVLEVVASDDAKEQQRAMHWAAKRTDMTIWCTKTFTPIEQALWASLPDKVKDHAFMLVTGADQLAQSGQLEDVMHEVNGAAMHEFTKIMPIATTDAIASRNMDGTVNKPLMQKSGGLTLISTILRQVDQGLQATIDQADLILHKFRNNAPDPENARLIDVRTTSRIISKPLPKMPSDETAPVVEVTTSKPVATGTSQPIPATEAPKAATAPDAFILPGQQVPEAELPKVEEKAVVSIPKLGRPVAPVAPVVPDADRKPRRGFMPKVKNSGVSFHAKPATREAYEGAVLHLAKSGADLMSRMDELSSDDLMQASTENITWLTDYLDDVDVKDDPVLEKGRTRALDAYELIQLMQFENNADAGLEALTLVVQLKRDMEAAVAYSKYKTQDQAA